MGELCRVSKIAPADVSNLAPLGILYDPTIAALGAFTLALAIHRRVPIEEALAAAGEMGTAFRVDVEFSEEGILGVDADLVKGEKLDPSRQHLSRYLVS
jgi:hypothetical protein